MTAKQYVETIAHDDHDSIFEKQVRVFTLKPKEQIPDLYEIIVYKEFQEMNFE